ncbi:MAG: hypothetical protein HZA68_10230 [Rhodovulum sp.]|nr:hypothetical protein [Rhodovulum sp.]
MRLTTLALVALGVAAATPAAAAGKGHTPTWAECYDLGWNRGVHVELGELPDWMESCLAGKIPFAVQPVHGSGSYRERVNRRAHR